eukprot:s2156_g15.t1
MVLSVDNAKTVARIEKLERIMDETIQQNQREASETVEKLVEIQELHKTKTRLFPGHPKWNEAVYLIALIYKPQRASHRLCTACLSETHDMMSLCFVCNGKLISHGWRKKKTIPTGGECSPDDDPDQDDVRDHVKEAWEHVKEEDLDDDEALNEEAGKDFDEDKDEKMGGANSDPDVSNARFKERERDDIDEYLEKEQKAESEEAKGATSGAELIHIVILMIANNLGTFLSRHYNLFCEGVGKLASAHAEKPEERIM